MYMQLQQHDTASNQFYSGLGLLSAGMFPGRNPNASMKWAQGMQQDPNSMFNNLVQIRGMQQQQASLDAFNRSIPDMMKQTGLTADEIRANPQAATELVGKIAATNAGISSDPTVQEMNRAKGVYMAQNGITDPNDPRIPDKYKYPAQYKAGAAADVAVATDKTDAANSFNSVDPQWKTIQDNLTWLNAHKDAVIAAVQHPEFTTTGQFGANLPSWLGGQPQDVLDAKANLDTLRSPVAKRSLQEHQERPVEPGSPIPGRCGHQSFQYRNSLTDDHDRAGQPAGQSDGWPRQRDPGGWAANPGRDGPRTPTPIFLILTNRFSTAGAYCRQRINLLCRTRLPRQPPMRLLCRMRKRPPTATGTFPIQSVPANI